MSIGQITLADASRAIFWSFVKGSLWVGCMRGTAYLLGVEWTWQIFTVCIASSIAETAIYANYSGRQP